MIVGLIAWGGVRVAGAEEPSLPNGPSSGALEGTVEIRLPTPPEEQLRGADIKVDRWDPWDGVSQIIVNEWAPAEPPRIRTIDWRSADLSRIPVKAWAPGIRPDIRVHTWEPAAPSRIRVHGRY